MVFFQKENKSKRNHLFERSFIDTKNVCGRHKKNGTLIKAKCIQESGFPP